jgi:hypothetical protein
MELYLKIYLACWFFTNFEPIQVGLDLIFEHAENKITDTLWTILSCQYCLTFWIALWVTKDITTAAALSVIAQIHTKTIK